jgi:exosortase
MSVAAAEPMSKSARRRDCRFNETSLSPCKTGLKAAGGWKRRAGCRVSNFFPPSVCLYVPDVLEECVSQLTSLSSKVIAPPIQRDEQSNYALIKAGVLSLLVFGIFWSSLWRLWSKTNPFYGEGNWGHAFIVPIIGLYYLYLHRDELKRAPIVPVLPTTLDRLRWFGAAVLIVGGLLGRFVVAPLITGSLSTYLTVASTGLLPLGVLVLLFNWGVGSLLFGLLTFGYGIWPGQNDYVKDLGLVITIFGIVLTLCGWQVMKIAWFPIAFLICSLPWPGLFYSWLASPLQELAATVAVFVLQMTGVDATQNGTKIIMDFGPLRPPRTLNVAEACAGLRSLMTFITVGAALAFLSSRPLWQRLFITFMAIPIAILCNVMRVAGQGLLDVYVSEKLAEGFAHQFVGLVMLVPAFFLLLGVCWIIDQLFVEEVEVGETKKASPATTMRRVAPAVMKAQPASAKVSAGESQ